MAEDESEVEEDVAMMAELAGAVLPLHPHVLLLHLMAGFSFAFPLLFQEVAPLPSSASTREVLSLITCEDL